MSSRLDVRLGSQTPTILHLPPDVVSLAAAEEAIELADAYGICDGNPLAESQKVTLRGALGERADGSWAATRIGDFGPRQGTGKSDKIAARELAGLLLFGEQLIIHTAHEFPTANECFLRLVAVFENWDDLRRKVSRIRYANGEQGIELRTGQRLKYRARTGGSGRGFAKADLVVYDEAQHLAAEHLAASAPSKLANPNSQSWYAGSGGLSTSAKAWELRRAALSGSAGRLAYTEMTAEKIEERNGRLVFTPPDPDDRDVWYQVMPGLGRWVTEEGVEALRDELGELFAREGLCVWDPDATQDGEGVIPLDVWRALKDESSKIVSHHQLALDVSPDRKWATFAAAGRRADGLLHVEPFDHRPRTDWVLGRAVEVQANAKVPLRVQKGSPAAAFIDPLRERGVDVVEVSTGELAEYCGQFIDAASNDGLRHLGNVSLESAVKGAELRTSGDALVWSRRTSKVDISPLVAVTIALGGVPQGVGVYAGGFSSLADFVDE
jgi:hypothetical protein